MRKKLLFLLKYYLFWIFLSFIAKGIFLFYQKGDALPAADYCRIFWHGLRIDLSLGGYIIMLSCVFLAFSAFLKEKIVRTIFAALTIVLLVFFSVVMTVDLELFRNWGFHMDTTPLFYLKTPKEAMASTPAGLMFGLAALMAAFVFAGWQAYKRLVVRGFHYQGKKWIQIPVFLLLGGAMIIPIRGGLNVAPMNSSFVYFHTKSMFANQAAVNPVWNFVYELMHINSKKNDYHFMPDEQAALLVDSLFRTDTVFPHVLTNRRPDIVVLLLESFTANAIEVLGGAPGVTPNLNRLAKEGILFSDIYATATRSDRGMLGAVSAIPSHPDIAMIKYPNKTMARPRFPKDLEANGYHTRYYYAGDVNFGGFRSYVTMSFQDMVTEDDFSGEAKENRFKWGIHDEYMFDRLYEDMEKAPSPFMYMAFNMSSHEPFEVPMETKIPGTDMEHKFLNAIYYTDSCIGNFIEKCKASGIWDHTLFVLMADHGTRYIGNLDPSSPDTYRIPLILTGGVLNVRDTVIPAIGSQTDMVATLFAQLGIDHSGYRYSKNLLAEGVVPFAFYSYPNAAGVVSENGNTIYNLQSRQFTATGSLARDEELLKACLQMIDKEHN